MLIVERVAAALALFAAAHFSMGFINSSPGGSGGSLLFPFSTSSASTWVFGSLDRGVAALLIPVMIGLAGLAVLAFFLAFLATFGLWVPTDLWPRLVLIGAICSAAVLVLHPSIWIVIPLALDVVLLWVAWTEAWTPVAPA